MDYPTFGYQPWTVFTQFSDTSSNSSRSSRRNNYCYNGYDDGGSVCSSTMSSPPPSPMSPSPSIVSNEDSSLSFQFSPEGSQNGNSRSSSSNGLCHDVPAMLGLGIVQQKQSDKKVTPTVGGGGGGGRTSTGFYKRMLEWISRKKKSHRRYSEVVSDRHLMAVSSSCRNQSAPMIFDIQQRPDLIRRFAPKSTQPSPQLNGSRRSSGVGVSVGVGVGCYGNGAHQSSGRRPSLMVSGKPPPAGTFLSVGDQALMERLQRLSSSSSTSEDRPLTPTPSVLSQSIEKQESEDRVDAEWIIPWTDIEIGQVVNRRGSCTIYSGRWHGDVILHQFELKNSTEVASFWSEVQSLTKLRHENLLLFMGIATERPHYDLTCHPASRYVIVNSAPRGLSVASVRSQAPKNGKPERIGMRCAVSIARQVSQATGYLHARGIVHGKLNPHNIFLEGDNYRVKLSLLDHALADDSASSQLQINYGCVPKTPLSYYSPELVRSMIVQPPDVHFSAPSTKYSDVYALGSFMFDLIAGQAPFHQEEVDSILWRIGSGQITSSLQDVNCNSRLKELISSCWSNDVTQRPNCVDIVRRLQPSALLCKSHSCSEPERLNRLGMCKLAC